MKRYQEGLVGNTSDYKFAETLVNDVHSQLNLTRVTGVIEVKSRADIIQVVKQAGQTGQAISTAAGRHAMGGQQFAAHSLLMEMSRFKQVLAFDRQRGTITVQAGLQWPELMAFLAATQAGESRPWGIVQKQTGADCLSIGGALSANVHGRGLRFRPIIQDVESFVLIDAQGQARYCSRKENYQLFCLAIGGYGLFGVIVEITLKLQRRVCLRRDVEILTLPEVMPAFEKCLHNGYMYGDFQFAIDSTSRDFLNKGVFSAYKPMPDGVVPRTNKVLSPADWDKLVYLAHSDPAAAFELYKDHYLASNGQFYWSDTHQLSTYKDNYHQQLNQLLPHSDCGTEVISELYVPREALVDFMREAAAYLRWRGTRVIYGTVRLIERDGESFLAWAKEAYACVIFNLHTTHDAAGIERTADAFCRLIDLAIKHKGSFYLTYHKYAGKKQIQSCYPQFPDFLKCKHLFDPQEIFQSNWYRHYRTMFKACSGSATGGGRWRS